MTGRRLAALSDAAARRRRQPPSVVQEYRVTAPLPFIEAVPNDVLVWAAPRLLHYRKRAGHLFALPEIPKPAEVFMRAGERLRLQWTEGQ